MTGHEWLAEQFESNRGHLRGVAYRMLGSQDEADDAVQETWLRLSRSGADGVENLRGWLTTVVSRVCLDMLRSRKSRAEEPLEEHSPEPMAHREEGSLGYAGDPERETLMADSVGLALLMVLETLAPAERVAFVLHDMFDVPFEEIAAIVGRSPAAARQLASRGRRRVQGAATVGPTGTVRRREVIAAFLAAARRGDFEALLAVLDPEVEVRADQAAVKMGASNELRGAAEVAGAFVNRARGAQPAIVGGIEGLVWAPGGRPRVVFNFTIAGDKITAVELIADPEHIRRLEVSLVEG